MAELTTEQKIEMAVRRVQRISAESTFVNTLNVADRIIIDFVWYPGADDVIPSVIEVTMPVTTAQPVAREIEYKWSRSGMADIVRNLASGRITLPLGPGNTGVLTVFDTQWKITRARTGVAISPSTGLRGIQQRLNILGYHLRKPGADGPGIDATNGGLMERAILAFQVDYRKPAGAPVGSPAGPLLVRGEPVENSDLVINLSVYNHRDVTLQTNPSTADSVVTQKALVAMVGA